MNIQVNHYGQGKQTIHICMVGNIPQPFGGVGTHCYYLCHELVRAHTVIDFVDTERHPEKDIPDEITYYSFHNNLKDILVLLELFKKPRLFFRCIRSLLKFQKCVTWKDVCKFLWTTGHLAKIVSRSDIHIIHSQHAYPRSLAALIAAQYFQIPFGVTVHCSEFTYEPYVKKCIQLATYIVQEAHFTIAVSQHTKREMQSRGIKTPIQVIYNGIDTQQYHPGYSTEQIKEKYEIGNELIILYVGWLIQRKGPHVVLNAIPNLQSKKKFKVFIIGPDHGFESDLRNMVKEMGLSETVNVLGKVSVEELHSFYSLADIFIFPTITKDEGFGIVAVEAMASKTAVIGSSIAAIPEVVDDGRTGLLFQPGDAVDLAVKIDMLLDNEELREQYALNGMNWVRTDLSWDTIARQVRRVYSETLEGYPPKKS